MDRIKTTSREDEVLAKSSATQEQRMDRIHSNSQLADCIKNTSGE